MLIDELNEVCSCWEVECGEVVVLCEKCEKFDVVCIQIEKVWCDYDFEEVVWLEYGELFVLEKDVQDLEKKFKFVEFVYMEVIEEDIVVVVSCWIGIFVSKLMEGECEKLLYFEE